MPSLLTQTTSAPIKLLLDEMPLTHDLQKVSDYSAYQVLSLTALPLTKFKDNKLVGLGATGWSTSNKGKSYSFYLDPRHRWSDGSQITAHDYVRAFSYLKNNPKLRFSRLLQGLCPNRPVTVEGNLEIRFHLQAANGLFPSLLTTISCSPRHRQNIDLASGAYFISRVSRHRIQLLPNPFFFEASGKTQAIEFHQISEKKTHDIYKVLEQEFDQSCSTAFPYELYQDLRDKVTRGPLNMAMLLSLGDKFEQVGFMAVNNFFSNIDRQTISKKLSGLLKPIYAYSDLDKLSPLPRNKPRTTLKPMQLEIAYEDYYPNYEILCEIKKQAKQFRIEVSPIKEAYGSRSASCHLRLEIRQSPIPGPFLFYKSEIMNKIYSKHSFHFFDAVTALSNYKKTGLDEHLEILDKILVEESTTLPLFEVPGLVVKSNRMHKDNQFTPGKVWLTV